MSPIFQLFKVFIEKIFVNKQATTLIFTLVVLFTLMYLYSAFLMPLLLAGGITYTLNGPLTYLHRKNISNRSATIIVFGCFLVLFALVLFSFPLLVRETTTLVGELINILTKYSSFEKIVASNPFLLEFASDLGMETEEINESLGAIFANLSEIGADLLTLGIASIFKEFTQVLSLLIYLVVLPILVFYMMWDSENIGIFIRKYTSSNEEFSQGIWAKMDSQMANYIRGKVIEIMMIGLISFIMFTIFGLKYSFLLALLSGLSTIIPVVGATIVTIPVIIIAGIQFGFGSTFAAIVVLYLILQFLDGYVLVPKLFSEVMKLHPLVILGSVFLFGGIWGFWGAFFAVPIATFIRVLLDSWPAPQKENVPTNE